MHKDIPVCLMEISDDGELGSVRLNNSAARHFPPGGQMNNMKFHEWWRDRAVPKTRHGAVPALQKLGYSSTNSMLVNNLALSLSDCYWIKPRGESLTWAETNLFTNDFVDTFGELTINRDQIIDLKNVTRFNFATSQGELQKKWCIGKDGRRYMVKGNYGMSYQQSLNEVFATELHRSQGFENFAEYSLVSIRSDNNVEGLGCMCYDFCSENVESLSAWELLQTTKFRTNESLYFPFKQVCLDLGMSEEAFNYHMDYLIMTDHLISNTDRHMNNIAVLRDPDTLELIGFAPIYDSGNSMFYNTPYDALSSVDFSAIKTHSFIEKEVRLLQYVHDRNAVDLDKAASFAENGFSIYENDVFENRIRIPKLKALYERKLNCLSDFQAGRNIWRTY